jgi:signal transduction histidine kinase
MRDEFIGIASHELFTPVTSVVVAIRGLRKLFTGPEGDPSTRLLRGAERQIERLSRLVRQLLDVTRIDGGRLTLSREEVDLCDVARDVTERLAHELERDQIAIELLLPQPVRGRWDRDRLDQVVTNLLTNAIKFGESKPITLTVRAMSPGAVLEVADQGIGIAADRHTMVFERFQRAVSAHHFAGLGLGLFITKQIVEEHGGRVRLESEVGVGSKFSVELPLDGEGGQR